MEERLSKVESICTELIEHQTEAKKERQELRDGIDDLGSKMATLDFNIKSVEATSKETAKSVEKIMTNHLPHIQGELKWTKWIVVFGISIVAILVGLFGYLNMP